jgi:hypothetical protein
VWNGSTASLAAWRAPVKPRHLGVGAGFIDEDEALRVQIDLPSNQSSRAAFISPLLGVRCPFFKCDLSALEETPESMLADIPQRFNRSRNSASVISGFTVTASKINCEYLSMCCDLWSPPWRFRNDIAS